MFRPKVRDFDTRVESPSLFGISEGVLIIINDIMEFRGFCLELAAFKKLRNDSNRFCTERDFVVVRMATFEALAR